jgi:hypothetical protein
MIRTIASCTPLAVVFLSLVVALTACPEEALEALETPEALEAHLALVDPVAHPLLRLLVGA